MRGRLVAAALLVPLLVGCGSRAVPEGGGEPVAVASSTSAGGASESAVPTDGASGLPTTGAGESASPTASVPAIQPSSSASPNFGPKHNNGVVKLALSAECVTPGSLLVVTITAPAKAGLGMVIGYSDHQAHGAMLTGETDAGGRYTWRVPVDPTVPEGDARVLVSATGPNWSQEGGGTADKVFRVVKSGC